MSLIGRLWVRGGLAPAIVADDLASLKSAKSRVSTLVTTLILFRTENILFRVLRCSGFGGESVAAPLLFMFTSKCNNKSPT